MFYFILEVPYIYIKLHVGIYILGDFDVPSSREDVDKDSVWNQWLRNEIHSAFIDALDTFKVDYTAVLYY